LIDLDEFCYHINIKNNILSQQLFNYFDKNKDNVLNFREFLLSFQQLISKNLNDKIQNSFDLFKVKDKEYISKLDLKKMLE